MKVCRRSLTSSLVGPRSEGHTRLRRGAVVNRPPTTISGKRCAHACMIEDVLDPHSQPSGNVRCLQCGAIFPGPVPVYT